MALQKAILDDSFPVDTQVAANSVVIASGSNVGNLALGAAGGFGIGVVQEQATGNASPYYARVRFAGIAQCRSLTGTAIAVGDKVKIADAAGRVTKLTPAAAGAGTLKGVTGIALSAVASGDATDTLIDVYLTPGVALYE